MNSYCDECDYIWVEEIEGRSCPICTDMDHSYPEEEHTKLRCTAAEKVQEKETYLYSKETANYHYWRLR